MRSGAIVSNSSGEKIAKILEESGGSWKEVELTIKKTLLREEEQKLSGKCFTRLDLENEGWTEFMIENSRQWAIKNGTHRVSEVHGVEEWSFPKNEEWSKTHRQSEEQTATTSVNVQDCELRLWDSCLPKTVFAIEPPIP